MKFEDRLTEKINRKTGQTVPDGYFELVIRQVEARLPERDDLSGRPAKPLSRWHRIRPYVYLAAMFAGIWCMMKMFHDISDRSSLNIDNPPALVAQAISDPSTDVLNLDSYTFEDGETSYEVEQDVIDSYSGMEELVRDFDYTFDPEYNSDQP